MNKQKKHNGRFAKIGLFILIIASLFLTGCTPKPTDKEIYSVSYVVHDINASTPNVFAVPSEKYGRYSFSYGLPGSAAEHYNGHWFFFSPGQFAAGSTVYPVAVGMEQTVYAYGENPVPLFYKNFTLSLNRGLNLDFIRAENILNDQVYQGVQEEQLVGGGEGAVGDNYIALKPGEVKHYGFGGPYTPGSVMLQDSAIRLRGEVLGGENTRVYKVINFTLCKQVVQDEDNIPTCPEENRYKSKLDEPTYTILKDDVLVANGYLGRTDYYSGVLYWHNESLDYWTGDSGANYTVIFSAYPHRE